MIYVTMTDKFMSGWGGAKGRTAKLVIACETRDQADRVERNARNRPEMKYINMTERKPSYPRAQVTFRAFAELGEVWIR